MKPYSGGIRHDYKNLISGSARRAHRWSWFAAGLVLPLLTLSLLLVSERNESKLPSSSELIELNVSAAPLPLLAIETMAPQPFEGFAVAPTESSQPIERGLMIELLVKPGDSLDSLFRRHDLSLADLAAMTSLPEAREHLRLLRPGDKIEIAYEADRVLRLGRELDEVRTLEILRDGETGFRMTIGEREIERRLVRAEGEIRSSLFEAGVEAGISDATTMGMAGIFQWDIDFLQDVRRGDRFAVIYEELWRDGVKLRNGPVVAAEFINRGEVFRAARYSDPTGRTDYFTPDGRSVRKAFIRAPVDFTRISSNFDPNRRHPVLNTIRAHRGVDYAAPTGTPVKAAGDGKVIFRGVKGGYGNAVILQHGGNITTLYGHLSRFGKPRNGSRVRQGDIIGYVGKTGLATGPHLHYEYQVSGVHRNPRTVALPPADPVAPEHMDDFRRSAAALWQQLDAAQPPRIVTASN